MPPFSMASNLKFEFLATIKGHKIFSGIPLCTQSVLPYFMRERNLILTTSLKRYNSVSMETRLRAGRPGFNSRQWQ
jgi:hypothetical protein